MPISLSETAFLISSALQSQDVRAMRKINDRCIQETAVKFSRYTYNFALISYVLSKIISKPRYFSQRRPKEAVAKVAELLAQCEEAAKSANYSQLGRLQEKMLLEMQKIDDEDRRFVRGIVQKARLKIAAILYAQGISLGNASQITGTEKRELLLYAGQTTMFDRLKEKKSMQERMRDLRRIFP
ncbi:MAG: hypothetical protein N3F07_03595 [Candidatus Micrarchaeota archaeon]|nr:hypothetical protein [Candidatus Micrarchaeota archaeon]